MFSYRTFQALFLGAAISATPLLAQAETPESQIRQLCEQIAGQTHKLTLKDAADILEKEGYRITSRDEDSLKIKINGRTLVLFRFDDGDFQFYYGSTGIKVDYKTINEWNRSKRLSRAYIDRVGDPVVEADLLGDAGLTPKQLISFTKTFSEVTVPAFRAFIIEKGE